MASIARTCAVRTSVIQRALSTSAVKNGEVAQLDRKEIYPKLGNRDVVGFGINGMANYIDHEDFPCPAIRFGDNSPEVMQLREKEKGDWKALTLDEKKTLYRASFRMTYSEMNAPTGEWKSIVAAVLLGMSVTGWGMIFLNQFVYPPLPHTTSEEWKIETVKQMVQQRQGRIEGLSSKYDYEKNDWK